MPVGLWDQDPNTDDLVASYSLYVGRIFREGLIGGAPRGGGGAPESKNGKLSGKGRVLLTPMEGVNGAWMRRLCGGPWHVEPLADVQDGTGLQICCLGQCGITLL